MLGIKFEVRNFGSNRRTMLRKGDYPYWNDPAYKEAQNYLPNIVIIKLVKPIISYKTTVFEIVFI
jgi:acyl-CoA thioesterase-1